MAAIPGTLYRRLAEVIDGYRTGRTAWFALALEFPHDPLTTTGGETAFESESDASDAIRRAAGGTNAYQVFGPCKTQRELSRLALTKVTTRDLDGNVKDETLDADVDLVLWSMSAFDKFVVPYYFQLYGRNDEAFTQIMDTRRKVKESGVWSHKWPTKGASTLKELIDFDPFVRR